MEAGVLSINKLWPSQKYYHQVGRSTCSTQTSALQLHLPSWWQKNCYVVRVYISITGGKKQEGKLFSDQQICNIFLPLIVF